MLYFSDHIPEDPDHEVEDLHGADEREAGEEPHGASYSGQLVHELGCLVLKQTVNTENNLMIFSVPW